MTLIEKIRQASSTVRNRITEHNPTSFTYIHCLIDKRPLYVVKTADCLVFAKFTMRYGLQAHVDAAEKGFVPACFAHSFKRKPN